MTSNRTKKTGLIALARLFSIGVTSVLGLFATHTLISIVGSDYNGISSTASQITSIVSLVEAGFTTATLVKLYKPYGESDYAQVSKYLSYSKKIFEMMGFILLAVGVIIVICTAGLIKSNAPTLDIVLILLFPVVSAAFSLFCFNKYLVLFQVSQTEYVYFFIQSGFSFLIFTSEIIALKISKNILIAKSLALFFQLMCTVVLSVVARKKFKFISFDMDYASVKIEGTRDLFISKLCAILFSSLPVVFVSIFIGTESSSVYATYNAVYVLITNCILAVIESPKNAIGQLVNKDIEHATLNRTFNEFEFISNIVICILLTCTFVLVVPFIRIYTRNVTDINYIDGTIALLLLLNGTIQLIHIPSGIGIEVAAKFSVIKKIQIVSTSILLVSSCILGYFWGLYGILIAKILTSFFLAVSEIFYVRTKLIINVTKDYLRVIIPNYLLMIIICYFEYFLLVDKNMSFILFFVYCIIIFFTNVVLFIGLNLLINRTKMKMIMQRGRMFFFSNNKNKVKRQS